MKCRVCVENGDELWVERGGMCVPCADLVHIQGRVTAGLIAAALVTVILVIIVVRRKGDVTSITKTLLDAKDALPVSTLKQMTAFLQLSVMLPVSFSISWPSAFLDWLKRFDFMRLEIMCVVTVFCVLLECLLAVLSGLQVDGQVLVWCWLFRSVLFQAGVPFPVFCCHGRVVQLV